jgi:hypothetical protein
MAEQKVLLCSAEISIPRRNILKNCEPFQDNPDFLKSPSHIRLAVGEELLRTFLAALDRAAPELTTANLNDLSLLCEGFGFAALLSQISEFRFQRAFVDE